MYLAHLTTFLATDLPAKNIDTVEELVQVQKNIKVLTIRIERVNSTQSCLAGHRSLDESLVQVTKAELDQVNSLKNTSVGYLLAEDRTLFLFKQQERLKRPTFHVMKYCPSFLHVGLLMPMDSPFLAPFNDYLMKVLRSGLIPKWEMEAVDAGKFNGDFEIKQQDDYAVYRPLNTRDLQFAWLILLIGSASFLGIMVISFRDGLCRRNLGLTIFILLLLNVLDSSRFVEF